MRSLRPRPEASSNLQPAAGLGNGTGPVPDDPLRAMPLPRLRALACAIAWALVLATLWASPAAAQPPDAAWKTLETARYRVHYPAAAEEWVLHLVPRLEPIRDRVEEVVGHADPAVVDILVQDPLAAPNGFAWPIPGSPRMVLWLTPPGSSSVLGRFHDWAELLVIHEQVHLSHLLRPSRNPLERRVERHLLPVRSIAFRSPRWVTEGYATVLEGRLTGAGRPHGHFRAALLRRWAQEGRLPSYGALAAGGDRWMGPAMAYLAGSAYLEWLEERSGPESLPHLWRRMTSRERRSFEEAFRGVFGGSPSELYARFAAELAHSAIETERRLEPMLREGERVQRHGWGVGAPAVSPDGETLVMVRLDRQRPPRLVVLATAIDEEAVEKRRKRQAEILERDPEDVAAVEVAPPPREVRHEIELRRSTITHEPRWLGDGSVLLTQAVPDTRGDLHGDLFRWRPGEPRLERLTRGAAVRQADPAPGGEWAAAVRSRWGKTELVRVALPSGEVTSITGTPRVEVIHDAPRVSPDGGRLAFLRHREERWELVVRDLERGEDSVVPTPEGADIASPAWSADGSHLYLVVGAEGLLDVVAYPVTPEGQAHQVTRSRGGALAPAPAPGGRHLYYLSLEPDGLDLRLLDLDAATVQVAELPLTSELVPAVPPAPPPEVAPLPLSETPVPRPYGLGRGEWSALSGGGSVPAGGWLEVGARGGDLVGRWEALALVSWAGGAGPHGGAAIGALRRFRLPLTLHLFAVEEEPSRQSLEVPGLGAALDLRQRGVAVGTAWDRNFPSARVELRLDGVWSRVEGARLEGGSGEGTVGVDGNRSLLSLEARGARGFERGLWRLRAAGGAAGQVGETASDGWRLATGRAGLEVARGGIGASLAWEGRTLAGDPGPADHLRLGGLAPTALPAAALGHRLFEPALPAGSLLGTRSESWRVSAGRRGSALRPFWARHTLRGGGASGTLSLAGLETELELPAFPLLRLPELRLQAGAARLLDPPFEGTYRGWVALTYRP